MVVADPEAKTVEPADERTRRLGRLAAWASVMSRSVWIGYNWI